MLKTEANRLELMRADLAIQLHRKPCGTATLFVASARLAPSEEGDFRSRHSHIAKV
jgi:hypothetical protein